MFHTRYRLHREAYKHRVVHIIQTMWVLACAKPQAMYYVHGMLVYNLGCGCLMHTLLPGLHWGASLWPVEWGLLVESVRIFWTRNQSQKLERLDATSILNRTMKVCGKMIWWLNQGYMEDVLKNTPWMFLLKTITGKFWIISSVWCTSMGEADWY